MYDSMLSAGVGMSRWRAICTGPRAPLQSPVSNLGDAVAALDGYRFRSTVAAWAEIGGRRGPRPLTSADLSPTTSRKLSGGAGRPDEIGRPALGRKR